MLRNRLSTACDHVTPERNIALVAAAGKQFPHSIVSLPSAYDLFQYTCLVHALDFTNKGDYLAISTLRGHDVFAGKEFAQWLLGRGQLVAVAANQASPDALVIYLNDAGTFEHVGILRPGGRVESKWGQLGLYEHNLFEVPSNYGNTVRYLEPISYCVAIKLFYNFAKEKGVEFQ